jgi:hypothetical protein
LRIHLINPSDTAFGTAVITPRWLFVLAAATPSQFGDPILCDETVESLDPATIQPGDVVGIGIHTGMLFVGTPLGVWHMSVEPQWYLAGSTLLSIQMKLLSEAAPIAS